MKHTIARQQQLFQSVLNWLRWRSHTARRHQLAGGTLGLLAVATLVWMGISAWSQNTGVENAEASLALQTAQPSVPTYADLSRELAQRERDDERAEQLSKDLQQALCAQPSTMQGIKSQPW